MSYKVLYRKYRQTNFPQVVGQEIIVHIITNAIKKIKFLTLIYFMGQKEQAKLQ